MHPTSATSRIEAECCSAGDVFLTFKGRAAQPQTHPEDGINALDAMTLTHLGIALHRYKLPDDTRINDVVLEMSKIPNSVPELARQQVEISSFSLAHLYESIEMVKRVAEGAAHATMCELETEVEVGYFGRMRNETIGNVMREELIAVGEPMLEGFHMDMGGEDFGNVSRVIPGNMMYISINPEKKISGHTELFRQKAASEDGRHCLYVSGKALARAALVFMQDEELIAKAKAELAERIAAEQS
ncbi:MAG: hypothetical protein IJH87_02020, partial [Atopobiaceae bacterium]|nr:hypothetical protein [Atopobiaceae bacterium]